jgi:diguanylate cyclase (GGDEF)-like protein/PAS domain S-box-containing protein
VTGLSRHILEQVLGLSSEAILLADAQAPDFPVVFVNPAYERLSGYRADELIGNPWPLLDGSCEAHSELGALKSALEKGEPYAAAIPDQRKDGTVWLSRIRVAPLYEAPGKLKYVLCAHETPAGATAGEREQGMRATRGNARSARKAPAHGRSEPFAGVLKWERFLELARRDFRMACRDRRTISIMLFEIVELDVYRQTFGAKAADSCLRMAAAQVAGTLKRAGDLCAVWGSDAIVALIHGQETAEAGRLGERIAQNVRSLGLHNPRARLGHYVHARVGIAAEVPSADEQVEDLIDRAHLDLGHTQPAIREVS